MSESEGARMALTKVSSMSRSRQACVSPTLISAYERDKSQVGPNHASWPMHSCGNTAIKGCSWPNFWANLASF
jgi:hypothetical protein